MSDTQLLRRHEIPGRVVIAAGNGGLPKVNVTTGRSTAEVYLHGAHVSGFQKSGEPPVLFLSRSSLFAAGKPIRGGVPLIFPWFGPREGFPAHGFARTTEWKLVSTAAESGVVTLRFHLPQSAADTNMEFTVTVADKLSMELVVTNTCPEAIRFENCLHTYFTIGDVNTVSVRGLKGVEYLDKVAGGARVREAGDVIRIGAEVDRVYLNTIGAVDIHDPTLRRTIRVEKGGSASTVVWNPWINKSKAMADFGDEEYKQMVCVESGNVAENKVMLAPGGSSSLKVVVSSLPG